MPSYHMHKTEAAITDEAAIQAILEGGKFATLAFARGGEPYLVTMNYGYEPEQRVLYFHSAPDGLKLDFARANPQVCGTVIVDEGYLPKRCSHAYRSVVFWGRVQFLETVEDKAEGLGVMIDCLEPDPAATRKRLLSDPGRLENVAVFRVVIEEITGRVGK
ncbi:MAG: pyridoxamine 5'-phosphate oxidase family protein [Anaerolineae bacterium]|nr:pyridoxamine 5'-phosphate oxidase family protein [Anaerolineae bacterium]